MFDHLTILQNNIWIAGIFLTTSIFLITQHYLNICKRPAKYCQNIQHLPNEMGGRKLMVSLFVLMGRNLNLMPQQAIGKFH